MEGAHPLTQRFHAVVKTGHCGISARLRQRVGFEGLRELALIFINLAQVVACGRILRQHPGGLVSELPMTNASFE